MSVCLTSQLPFVRLVRSTPSFWYRAWALTVNDCPACGPDPYLHSSAPSPARPPANLRPRHRLASPGARAHAAEGRGLVAFSKDLEKWQPINREWAGRPQREGAYVFPKANKASEKEVCDPDVWRSWVLLRARRDKLVSSLLPAFLDIPSPTSHPSRPRHQAQGFPQAWFQSLKASAPHPLTATALLNPRDRHVGLPGWFPFLPLPPNPTFPCYSLIPAPAKTGLQERAAQLIKWHMGRKGVPDVLSFSALGVPSGFEMTRAGQ